MGIIKRIIHRVRLVVFLLLPQILLAQKATITEQSRELVMYPFSDLEKGFTEKNYFMIIKKLTEITNR